MLQAAFDDLDTAYLRSAMIEKATVAFCKAVGFDDAGTPNRFEDVARMWDSAELQERLGVQDKIEVVDKVLASGEKDVVLDTIDELSGANADMEQDAKNS